MAGNIYKPEGSLIGFSENRSAVYSYLSLEEAMREGKILEGIATVCEEGMNL